MDKYDLRAIPNNYAPGIATYGIDGKEGSKGDAGTSIYFTSYNLEYGGSVGNESAEVVSRLNKGLILSKYSNNPNGRPYGVGDIVVDSGGYVYTVYERNSTFALKYVSRLHVDDSSQLFSKVGDRVMMESGGLDVTDAADSSLAASSDYPLRLVSTQRSAESGNNNILSMTAYSYGDGSERHLDVYYEPETDSFHFDTESNLVFDASSIMVNGTDDSRSFGEYYKIEPYNDPVGLLHKVYGKATWSLSGASEIVFSGIENGYPSIDLSPDYVKVRVFGSDGTVSREAMFPLAPNTLKSDATSFSVQTNGVVTADGECSVSVVKGVEIYVRKG